MSWELQTKSVSAVDASAELCPNCNEQLIGQYCNRCGERRVERDQLSLKHFIGSSIRELTDIEHSKLWKTFLALVFKPGFLTNEYFAGRKSRYLTPLSMPHHLCLQPVSVFNLQAGRGI